MREKLKKYSIIGLITVFVLVALYYILAYYAIYSKGIRSGELIKLSRKGVIIKTWEGEISQGISGAQIFKFSVEDNEEEVIEDLKRLQGKYVKLTYKERYTKLFWLGDTKYFIIEVEEDKSPHNKIFSE